MEKQISFNITPDEFEMTIEKTVRKVLNEKSENEYDSKVFSINEAAKEIGCAWQTVRNLIDSNTIKTTIDGKFITGSEIKRYRNA
jgi:hypothetical protein